MKQLSKNTPNSVLLWNGLALIAFIILCCIGEEVALGTMLTISIPAFFMIIINLQDARYDDGVSIIGNNYWAYLAPITWVLLVITIVIFTISWLLLKIVEQIKQFNNWLNKKEKGL